MAMQYGIKSRPYLVFLHFGAEKTGSQSLVIDKETDDVLEKIMDDNSASDSKDIEVFVEGSFLATHCILGTIIMHKQNCHKWSKSMTSSSQIMKM